MMGARWWNARAVFIRVAALAWLVPGRGVAQTAPELRLALELSDEGDHAGAALEFRRLAAEDPAGEARGGYYWAAAFEYRKAGEFKLADKMLDRAEDAHPSLGTPALLLRGENAQAAQQWGESDFYFESVLRGPGGTEEKTLASRRLATGRLRQRDADG
ncbi:MAG: hypothetical protein KKC51_11780, partial [Verrucomicrobia bacterium]|nr:hypothetical protein [Verrucomicrobiota bacterium]